MALLVVQERRGSKRTHFPYNLCPRAPTAAAIYLTQRKKRTIADFMYLFIQIIQSWIAINIKKRESQVRQTECQPQNAKRECQPACQLMIY